MTKTVDNKTLNQGIPTLPNDLPFNAEQQQWLGGFMAGLHSRLTVTADAQPSAPVAAPEQRPLTIIYGSQTGNAEGVAELAAEQATEHGLTPSVFDMDDVDIHQIAAAERLLVVASTYGEGEMTDNAEALWEAISDDAAPRFDKTHFSVCALGDTSYDGFCVAGKLWDERLQALGGQRIADRVDCDVDFDAVAQEWINTALPIIASKGSAQGQAEAAPAVKKEKSKFNRANPLPATLSAKKVLSGEASSKEIMHFEFSLEDSGETYDAGDAVNIVALNRPDLVEELLQVLQIDGDTQLPGHDKSVRALFTEDYEIRTPSRDLVAVIAERGGDEAFKALLNADDSAAMSDFLWGKDTVDLLRLYPAAAITIDEFIQYARPLVARAYSISSSIKKHDNEVHLTIGSVRYNSNDREHHGVCSTYLADVAEVGDTVHCYFAPNKNFSVPDDNDLPMIMVGPGTGIAPFRAFLEERECRQANGDNWLFFGDRNSKNDFIYQDELSAWQQGDLLTRLDLAFSRDQAEKIYVQDRMIENGSELFAWLEKGAYFYVCGDAFRMAKDVDKALHQVVETFGEKTPEQAIEYINEMKKQKRYVRDVY